MKKILILATNWSDDYWEKDGEAPYQNQRYTELAEWSELSKSCPLPAIGRYYDKKNQKFSESPFIYLKVTGMHYDSNTESPIFDRVMIARSKTASKVLYDQLPSKHRYYFSVVDSDSLIQILRKINDDPPEEWLQLVGKLLPKPDWKDHIGKFFLEISENALGNNEFEDRVAALIRAVGFKIKQKGHTMVGEYPDGIAFLDDDLLIVYDCKNTKNFVPTTQDIRALKKYAEDEGKIHSKKKIYCLFVAKSCSKTSKESIPCFSVDSLIYLLYKKIHIGPGFNLSPMKKILDNQMMLDRNTIDNEWKEF